MQEFLQVFHFILPKFLTTFFSHFLAFYISTIQNDACTQHFINIFGFHPSSPLPHFQTYNYSCTISIIQLQIITFLNCRNCHQLHV